MQLPTDDVNIPVTVVSQPETLDPEEVKEATTGAPAGLEGLLEFMAEGNRRKREAQEREKSEN
jgi:hypothetical protein